LVPFFIGIVLFAGFSFLNDSNFMSTSQASCVEATTVHQSLERRLFSKFERKAGFNMPSWIVSTTLKSPLGAPSAAAAQSMATAIPQKDRFFIAIQIAIVSSYCVGPVDLGGRLRRISDFFIFPLLLPCLSLCVCRFDYDLINH